MALLSPSSCHLGNFQSNFLFQTATYSKLAPHTILLKREKNMNKLKIMSAAAMDDSTTKRPLANFHPTVWGNYFLSYTPLLTEISSQEKFEHEELKEKVKEMLVETPDNSTQKLVLIDTIQRLGVTYHFKNEIKTSMHNIFDESEQNKNNDDDDLYVVALRFRLVRQQRHYMSSDVFKRFTNQDGKFKEILTKDVNGLLNLYEAAHLRIHGEEILEEALTFTTTHLESMVPNLSNPLKAQVSEALRQPIHKNIERWEARKYMSIYESIEAHSDHLLLRFAKLDFQILQKVQQRELSELTRWRKDLNFANKYPYARDKMVEAYFWTTGVFVEPQHRRARITMTKLISLLTAIDDTYDAYATYDELVPFTDAILRYDDISAMDSVPPYLRSIYEPFIGVFNEMEDQLSKEDESDCLYYAKFEMKKLMRAYLKEVEWLNVGYIPKCDEYIENATTSTGIPMLVSCSLIIMDEFITLDNFEWMRTKSSVLQASSLINRLKDDIIGHETEQQRHHPASFIECYMKEYEASKQEAYAEAQKKITNAWKDINTEFVCSSHMEVPTFIFEPAINFARLVDIVQGDDYTDSTKFLKDMITLMLVERANI